MPSLRHQEFRRAQMELMKGAGNDPFDSFPSSSFLRLKGFLPDSPLVSSCRTLRRRSQWSLFPTNFVLTLLRYEASGSPALPINKKGKRINIHDVESLPPSLIAWSLWRDLLLKMEERIEYGKSSSTSARASVPSASLPSVHSRSFSRRRQCAPTRLLK